MAKVLFDSLLEDLVYHSHPVDSFASDPATAPEGTMIINTVSGTLKIYYGGTWQTLHSLTPPTDYFLLMETGDYLLLETGDKIILE